MAEGEQTLAATARRRSGSSSTGSVITFDPDGLRHAHRRARERAWARRASGTTSSTRRAVSTEHSRADASGSSATSASAATTRTRASCSRWTATSTASIDGDRSRRCSASSTRLQEDALFNGEYDAGDAIVTIHRAATGGTDAQDWAEMLLRMYLRWAERRGFKAELIEASPGEEAGLKSATFTVRGENAYGTLKAERGVHRLVRLSPFDQAHRRHTSFAQVIVAPLLADDGEVEIDDERPPHRHLPRRAAPAASTSTRPTRPCASRTCRPASSCSARTSARRPRTSDTAMKILRSRLAELSRGAARGGAGAASAARCRTSASAARSAATCCTRTSWSRTTAPSTRPATLRRVLDGDLDGFIHAYLLAQAAGKALGGQVQAQWAPRRTCARTRPSQARRPEPHQRPPPEPVRKRASRHPDDHGSRRAWLADAAAGASPAAMIVFDGGDEDLRARTSPRSATSRS